MADNPYPSRTADGRGVTYACCESIFGPACGHRRGGFDPRIELSRLRRLVDMVLAGTGDPAAYAQALAHTARDLDHQLAAMVDGGDWLAPLMYRRVVAATTDTHRPPAARRATGPCGCQSGYADDPGTHNNQARRSGRCGCPCHGGM